MYLNERKKGKAFREAPESYVRRFKLQVTPHDITQSGQLQEARRQHASYFREDMFAFLAISLPYLAIASDVFCEA